MVPSPLQAVAAWLRARTHLMLTKAPKDAPWLLIAVLILGLIVLALFTLAVRLDVGAITL